MKENQRQQFYKELFESDIGQIVLKDLVDRHRVLYSSFQPDPLAGAFLEGRKAVVLDILRFLNVDLQYLQDSMKERYDRSSISD
mgnify:CR=1 FL=1|jgi:hypothetical protein|tara:strand:+ start:296 stop:547 length:252 start_codon:yes stop_codon:yes gene_type:complete